ncbi:hypothetical protein C6361_19430 [Plantactinospora sp. BC1]|uniref:hypothetical protein n=1 Tax=Plantactinospora sp. BC1 TaxID=2108470 RepID=UPI000D17CE6C|nr:hypothetical protein [Plantactinospora sp. BC1]AVT31293.1 hypothetical protein C6361_19430 [Plantactinospora sp. BC1]
MARRFARSKSLTRSTFLIAATAALLVAVFVALNAFTLSPRQVTVRDLGRFDSQIDLSNVTTLRPGGAEVADEVATAARAAGATDVVVALASFDVRPDMTRPPFTLYSEAPWPAEPFPDRYQLREGRWPSQPGEVVLTDALRSVLGQVESFTVFSGNDRLRVVGVAEDLFGATPRILAAQGTWASLSEATARNFSTVLATATLLWNGGVQQEVLTAVAAVVTGDAIEASPAAVETQLAAEVRTRADELTTPRRSWTDRIPLAYDLPSLALPLLAVLAVFGLNARRFRRSLATLTSIGMSRATATAGVAAATTMWTLTATFAGIIAGIGLGAASRPVVDRFLAGPISPWPGLQAPAGRLLGVTFAACVVAALLLHLAHPRPSRVAASTDSPTEPTSAKKQTRVSGVTVRRTAAGILGAAIVIQIGMLDTVPKAMVLTATVAAAVLLFTPEAVGAAIRLLPTSDPRIRLGRQQLHNDRTRAVAAVAVLTATLGAPLGLMTLLATLITTAQEDVAPTVAPHQVVLSGPGGAMHPPSPEVVTAVSARLANAAQPVRTGYLTTETVHVTVGDAGIGAVLVVDTPEQANRLNNGALTETQLQTLQRGGLLVWSDGPSTRTLLSHDRASDQAVTSSPPLPASHATFEPAWTVGVSGLLLTATAQRLNLTITPAAIVFTDVTDAQAAAAEQAAIDNGLDPLQVGIHQPPEPITVPPAYYAAVLGLAAIVLATTMAVARSQVITLRSYLGRLIAIGLSPRWARHVLLIQNGLVILTSTALATLIAVPPVVIAAVKLRGFTLSIPWTWLMLITAAFYLATLTATIASSRRLISKDRLTA